uniref:intramembrane prenyl-peptidase Rce1 n=1 Tax=Opuntia streptacantha TaxID=393608 RepID=A0A7C9DKL2_OPUST
MEMEAEEDMMNTAIVSKSMAVVACTAMTVVYVAILYAPTLILQLPPPTSYKQFMIRRFCCAAVSSLLSLLVSSALLLPIRRWNISNALALYGVRADHVWRILVLPFSLTSLMYMGSLVKSILLLDLWKEVGSESTAYNYICTAFLKMYGLMISYASNITAWRNLVVAPITEEIVFRACMIPLLLCGGFKSQAVIFICPVFFSLAHLNHLLEFYIRKDCSLLKTSLAVGNVFTVYAVSNASMSRNYLQIC